jgi:hypothetical protein
LLKSLGLKVGKIVADLRKNYRAGAMTLQTQKNFDLGSEIRGWVSLKCAVRGKCLHGGDILWRSYGTGFAGTSPAERRKPQIGFSLTPLNWPAVSDFRNSKLYS